MSFKTDILYTYNLVIIAVILAEQLEVFRFSFSSVPVKGPPAITPEIQTLCCCKNCATTTTTTTTITITMTMTITITTIKTTITVTITITITTMKTTITITTTITAIAIAIAITITITITINNRIYSNQTFGFTIKGFKRYSDSSSSIFFVKI